MTSAQHEADSMTQTPPLAGQRGFSQAKQAASSDDIAEIHPRSPSGTSRHDSSSNGSNAHPLPPNSFRNVISGGVTSNVTDNLLPKSRGFISSTDDYHPGENSRDEYDSGWRDRPTVSGASTVTTFIPAVLGKRKVSSTVSKPVKRHDRRSVSLDIAARALDVASRIDVIQPLPVSENTQISSPTVSNLQVRDAMRRRIPQLPRAFQSTMRSHGTPNVMIELHEARSRSASPFAVRKQKRKPWDISLATRYYTISQDHTRGEDARRSDLFASFGRTILKQPGTQAAPMDPFHANKSLVPLFSGGDIEVTNPDDTGDVLNDVDFDSFLWLPTEVADNRFGR